MRHSQSEETVRRRQIFFVGGYELLPAGANYDRFIRQLQIFKRTWRVVATTSTMQECERRVSWSVDTSGPNWETHADWEVWGWDDIVRSDAAKPTLRRLPTALIAYLDFLFTGTLFRYAASNLRYLVFAIVPPFAIVLFGIIALVGGIWLAQALALTGVARAIVVAGTGFVGFILLLRWPGRRWRLEQALDDWIFARDYIYGNRPDIDERLETFAAQLAACARSSTSQEIVIVGHSLGATLAIDVVARALARDPDLGGHGTSINILTVGATIPKILLHPAASRIRHAMTTVVDEQSIRWAEIHTRGDAISFYGFDPVLLRKSNKALGKLIIRRVQIHDMVQPKTYSRIRMRILRMHYQTVSANDRLAKYDYFMMGLGPVPFRRWIVARAGLLEFLEADGEIKVGTFDSAP